MKMNLQVSNIVNILVNERKNMHRSKLIIFPESTFKSIWDLIGFIFIIIQSIVIPFNICFNITPTGPFKYIDTCIDSYFLVDICNFIFLLISNKF